MYGHAKFTGIMGVRRKQGDIFILTMDNEVNSECYIKTKLVEIIVLWG